LPTGSLRYKLARGLKRVLEGCPAALRRRHHRLADAARAELAESLTRNYFSNRAQFWEPPEIYLATAAGQVDLADHLEGRLEHSRRAVVPWLGSLFRLEGARILEVGCGTGTTTVALAEQGALVTGVDVQPAGVQCATDRCRLHGVRAELIVANATEIGTLFAGRSFDCILFFACLEHMTLEERIAALRAAWNMLDSGQLLAVVETPNRLWHTDHHTSGEPFFGWLPDPLAKAYAARTRRPGFNQLDGAWTESGALALARWGRPVSFHELVLALDCAAERLPVVSSKADYFRRKPWLWPLYHSSAHERQLRRRAPGVHPAFARPDLDLVLRKP
jgi:S-adenosylmethionine-dependent methyltransferase